jgi:hypothetical protein
MIIESIVDHKSDGHDRKYILPSLSIEVSHVEEQMLLIAQALITLDFVVYPNAWRQIAFLFNRVLSVSLSQIGPFIRLQGINVSFFDPL